MTRIMQVTVSVKLAMAEKIVTPLRLMIGVIYVMTSVKHALALFHIVHMSIAAYARSNLKNFRKNGFAMLNAQQNIQK